VLNAISDLALPFQVLFLCPHGSLLTQQEVMMRADKKLDRDLPVLKGEAACVLVYAWMPGNVFV
jgi:hypothetical protein